MSGPVRWSSTSSPVPASPTSCGRPSSATCESSRIQRVLGTPLSTDEAISNLEAVLAPSHIRVAGEGDDFWTSFRRVAADVKPRGNLVPDAHLVALMREHGVSTIWSRDRDLRKFSGITVKDPFSGEYPTGFE